MQCRFFSKARLAELTNYVIRHITKYSNAMDDIISAHALLAPQTPRKPISLVPVQVTDNDTSTSTDDVRYLSVGN